MRLPGLPAQLISEDVKCKGHRNAERSRHVCTGKTGGRTDRKSEQYRVQLHDVKAGNVICHPESGITLLI
jgi:hypothetical protein